MFGILGHLAHLLGVDIKDVTSSNIALAFIAYPETISKIDFCPQFFSMMFFIMLFTLGIGSNIGMTSCILTVIRDTFPSLKCWKVVLAIAAVGVSVGSIYTTPGGQYVITFLDFYGASFVALILAIIEIFTVSWIYGVDRFCDDIEFMLGKKTGAYWRICWKFVTPAAMTAIFVYFLITWQTPRYQNYEFPATMNGNSKLISSFKIYFTFLFLAIGWSISCICLIQVPLWALIAILKQSRQTWKEKFLAAFSPNNDWGPNNKEKCKFRAKYNLL